MAVSDDLLERANDALQLEEDLDALLDARLHLENIGLHHHYASSCLEIAISELENAEMELREELEELKGMV